MPDEDNTEDKPVVTDPFKGTKFEGKTPQEIASMYDNLETRFGEQGNELGHLRGAVSDYAARQPEVTETRQPARVSDYSKYAENLIVDTDNVLPDFGEEVERRATERATRAVSQQMALRDQTENFFRDNPNLNEYREVVSVIGERIYAQNPRASFAQVLATTKRESEAYLANLEQRLTGKKRSETERKRAAMTTSGGSTREVVQEDETEHAGPTMSLEQQGIMDEVKRIKDSRAKKILPPRHR